MNGRIYSFAIIIKHAVHYKSLLINLKSEEDSSSIVFARRLRLKTKSISESDKEDFGLLKAMLEAETGENVSREEIMKALQS